jgi:glycosyltransferase involved in cell wall biosynthesis
MRISIITAVFNREFTLARSLNSVKNQTYDDIESVVIDGASTDKSIDIAKSVLNENDFFKSEKDDGVYDAFNKGILNSSGEIIGFLHSDDIYSNKHVVSKVAKIFLDRKVDIVYGDVSFFKKDNLARIVRVYKSNELSVQKLAWGKMPSHASMFIRKDIFNKHGLFNTSYKISGDYEFLCRILMNGDIEYKYVPEIFTKMQVGGISTSGLQSKILLNKEVIRACLDNNIYTNIFMIMSKYPSKLLEMFYKK